MNNLVFSQLFVMSMLAIPMFLVLGGRLRMDIAALLIAGGLGLAQFFGLQILGPAGQPTDAVKAISGFGQPVVITLVSLFILTRALEKSGVTRWIARKLIEIGGSSETRLIALFAATAAFLSLFMNNLAAGALVLPSAMEVSRRTNIKPSKLLIPVAYGSLLGGAATYFTTANIIVSDLLRIARPPQNPLNIFDFTPVGGLIAIAGIAFLAYFGKRLLPDHKPSAEQSMARLTGSELEDIYQISDRLWEAKVLPESPLVGQTLAQSQIGTNFGVEVAAIWRNRQAIFTPSPDQSIQAGDILLMIGREERVCQLQCQGLAVGREDGNGLNGSSGQAVSHISRIGVSIIEVIPSPRSAAVGHTLKELNFRKQYGFTAVALRRPERTYRTDVGDIPLALGDSILLVGARRRVRALDNSPDFIVLQPNLSDQPLDRVQVIFAVGAILAAITASLIGVPVYLAVLFGAIFVILCGILRAEEAYQAIEWQAVFLVSGMYAVSIAMVETGLAADIGTFMVKLTAPFGGLGLAAGAYLLTAVLTQMMGGQVTALVTGPVAISAAINMGVSAQAIAVATAIGCSASFLTPFAHPVNILMIAPANYTFKDFFHIGWRLTILSFIMLILGMTLFWRL